MVAAGCNVREVSEWAGHNSVAFTLTGYGGLFEDGADDAMTDSTLSLALSELDLVPEISSGRSTRGFALLSRTSCAGLTTALRTGALGITDMRARSRTVRFAPRGCLLEEGFPAELEIVEGRLP